MLSAIVDNIPFVATMIPLIKTTAPAFGGEHAIGPIWWCLSLGACLGGNGSLIGASANLIVAGVGDRNGVPFRFLTFTLYAFPMMLVSIAIAQVYVWLALLLISPGVARLVATGRGGSQSETDVGAPLSEQRRTLRRVNLQEAWLTPQMISPLHESCVRRSLQLQKL